MFGTEREVFSDSTPVSPYVLTMLDLEHDGPGYEWLDAWARDFKIKQKKNKKAEENNMK